MQDSIGGSFVLKLFMIFFIIYVFFIGIALNFAKIYRIKNNVINVLEQYQYNGSNAEDGDPSIYSRLEKYLNNVPYNQKNYLSYNNNFKTKCPGGDTKFLDLGLCIIKKGETDKPYFKVIVYYVVDFPFFNISDLEITASGETKIMED